MGKLRILILLVALAAGGGAYYMAQSGGEVPKVIEQVAAPVRQQVETVRVLVASQDIPQGAVLNAEATDWIDWPVDSVPEFYVTEADEDFLSDLPRKRALQLIRATEPVYRANTVQHGDAGLMAAIMTPGMRAVTAKLDAEQTSGGFILPGDRVDIYVSTGIATDEGTSALASLLMPNVRVLAIDQIYANDEEASAIVGRTVTLEMPPSQVETFIRARESMTLTLTLRSIFDDTHVEDTSRPSPDEVLIIRYGQG